MADYATPIDFDVVPHIVCAACRIRGGTAYVIGARHFDTVMQMQIKRLGWHVRAWDQGFIDQWGRFYDRTEALQLVTSNGQMLTSEPLTDKLYSENLY